MFRYLLGRLIGGLLTLIGVSGLAFFATALAPGSPVAVLLGNRATPERVEAVTRRLGLDEPLPIRYVLWLKSVLQGDLGTSNLSFKPVQELLAAALPVTLQLALFSLVVAVAIAIPLGLLLALNKDRWWARPLASIVTLGISVPGFWVGLMLITFFSVQLGWLPSGGYVSIEDGLTANLRSMVLPTFTLAVYLIPSLARFVRITAIAVLQEDFIDTARAKGARA